MGEIRLKREHFTKTLIKICSLLSKKSSAIVAWNWKFLNKKFTPLIVVESLWVAGSYARGASDCGDLDLILQYTGDAGQLPPPHVVAKAFFSSYPRVNIYEGAPSKNSSGIVFEEAILLWERGNPNWLEAINGIKPDPLATRYERPIDRLPLRREQITEEIETLEEIIDLEDKKIIQWSFTPLVTLNPKSAESPQELELERLFNACCGKKTNELLPYLLAYFAKVDCWSSMEVRSNFERTDFNIGGTNVMVGSLRMPIKKLDNIETSELLLIPHITTRGPNGFWSIRRGDKHPLVLLSKDLLKYTLYDQGGTICTFSLAVPEDFNLAHVSKTRAIDLYTSKRKATAWAKSLSKDDPDSPVSAGLVKGADILKLLSHADVIFTEEEDYPITRSGMNHLKAEKIYSFTDIFPNLEP